MRISIILAVFILRYLGIFNESAGAAEILACLSSSGRSHHIIQTTILEELARHGHNLTVLSTLPVHKKDLPANYHHIYLELDDIQDWAKLRQRMLVNDSKSDLDQFRRIPTLVKMSIRRSKLMLDHEIVQNMMKSNQHFDLFVLGYNMNEMMLGLAGHFRVPSVLITTLPAIRLLRDIVGNPTAVSNAPAFGAAQDMNGRLNCFKRLKMFFEYTIEFIVTKYVDKFMMERAYYEYFNESYPTYDEVKKNVSLVFLNSHFSQGRIRPYLPALVEIGGVHIGDVSPLRKVQIYTLERNISFIYEKKKFKLQDIQEVFDSSNEHGVILFSFGGNIKSADINSEKVRMFIRIFSRLKQNIIWKWENDKIPDASSKNIFYFKWVPQIDILAQPQIKFFISHCGAGGIYEAKYYGVPILGFPIYGDQLSNGRHVSGGGWGLTLNIDTMTEIELEHGVEQLLTNQTYKANAMHLSQLFRDRPMAPLQTAIYWIEYVIRYDGAKHMQSNAVHLNFFEANSLDIITLLIIFLYVASKVIRRGFWILLKHRTLVVISISIIVYFIFIY